MYIYIYIYVYDIYIYIYIYIIYICIIYILYIYKVKTSKIYMEPLTNVHTKNQIIQPVLLKTLTRKPIQNRVNIFGKLVQYLEPSGQLTDKI